MDILGAIAGVVGVVIAAIALYVTLRIARQQDQHQRELEMKQDQLRRDAEKRQEIRATCDLLSNHLTKWHDALRAAVMGEDKLALKQLGDDVDYYEVLSKKLEGFRENETYEGPLGYMLLDLTQYSECSQVVDKVNAFQTSALDFKEGEIATLKDLVEGHGHWSETKHDDPTGYNGSKNQELEKIRSAYQDAMIELQRLKQALKR